MKVEYTDNGDLNFSEENYKTLKRGVVIFPETEKEAANITIIKQELEKMFR